MSIPKVRIDAIIEALDAYGYQSYGLDILQMHEEIKRLKWLLSGIHEEARDSSSNCIGFQTMVDIENILQEQ